MHYAPAGHYYSPLPGLKDLREFEGELFKRDADCPGIDLREDEQLDLLGTLAAYYEEAPFPEHSTPAMRYYYENSFFSYGDAMLLYGLLRHLRPRQVIEVGSGFSSALMLDTDEVFMDNSIAFTFIDPRLDGLEKLIRDGDRQRVQVVGQPVQRVPLDRFEALEAGDILFIDSSHVVKIGSDVVYLLFEVLPRLKEGVVVHFHDIFWPFQYPEAWIRAGRAWNEAYFVRAFLQFNRWFEILYFCSFIAVRHGRHLQERMPLCLRDPGCSLWLRKAAGPKEGMPQKA
ncbi:MAG: class I SAM-dependent methyltransferase [Rhodothermales bacterium]